MKNTNRIILLLSVLNPILYFINPYLLLISIIVEHFIVIKYNDSIKDKLWKSFILSSSYFGIQFIGLKLYDIVLIIFLPFVILKNKSKIFNKNKNIFNISTLILVIYTLYLSLILFKNDLNVNSILEYIRYLMAFITIISFYLTIDKIEDFKSIIDIMPIYALKTLINGIFIIILVIYTNIQTNINLGLIKINIYNSLPEIRLTGFFSDPNKYFLYFMMILIIYEIYMYIYNYNNIKLFDKNNLIFTIGAISSFSRAGIIAIIVYFILKYINIKFFYDKQDKFLRLLIIAIVGSIIMIVIFPNIVISIVDKCIYLITVIMGREESLIYSPSLSESSRVLSWKVALQSTADSIATGNGLFSWAEFYYMPPHNTLVAIIQDTGIIGAIIFISLLSYIIINIPIHITLVLLLIPLITFDLQNYRLLYLIIAICGTLSRENIRFNKLRK